MKFIRVTYGYSLKKKLMEKEFLLYSIGSGSFVSLETELVLEG